MVPFWRRRTHERRTLEHLGAGGEVGGGVDDPWERSDDAGGAGQPDGLGLGGAARRPDDLDAVRRQRVEPQYHAHPGPCPERQLGVVN